MGDRLGIQVAVDILLDSHGPLSTGEAGSGLLLVTFDRLQATFGSLRVTFCGLRANFGSLRAILNYSCITAFS